jgi:ribosomal protein S18 acetylase RimI-like enzyme
MKIKIEKANIEDADELIEVQNKSFREDFTKYGECPSYNEDYDNFVSIIKTTIFYKIIHDEKIIGDIIIRKKGEGKYYLRTISIIPEFQNKGIGKKAIEFIEKNNSDGEIWTLITPKDNSRNCHFYEKMGYIKTGEYRQSDVLTLVEYRKDI